MSPFLVVTGMHRSTTSLLGQVLENAGINFGDKLVSADSSNPYGYFEDCDILKVHEEVLRDNGTNWHPWTRREYAIAPERRAQIEKWVGERTAAADGPWGFKVPHATLLLPFWASFPQAKFVFVFRAPEPVFRSLLRRMNAQVYYKPYAILNYLFTYTIYNRNILEFVRAHRDRCHLIHGADLISRPTEVVREMAARLDLAGLRTVDPGMVDASVLERKASAYVRACSSVMAAMPGPRGVYRELERLTASQASPTADLHGASPTG